MAMIGKPYNPNAMVPPVNVTAPPIPAQVSQAMPELGNLPTLQAPKPKINWMGILADALSGLAGNGPIYAPMAARRQDEQTAFERGEEQYRRRRDDSLRDQMQLLDYKRLHPDDALTQALDQAGITDPAERQKYYRADVERRTAPPMMSAQGFDEQGNPVMRFFPRAMPQSAPPAVLQELPKGVIPIGGPTASPSGGFRRPY